MKFAWIIFLPGLASAAVWPEAIGSWKRTAVQPAAISDRAIWDEYGFKEGETATYASGEREFHASGYRLQDPTGALAAYQWQRPSGATNSKLAPYSAQTAKGVTAVHGNFLFAFEDYQPSADEFAALTSGLRNLDTSPFPPFLAFIPEAGRTAGSERYLLGPASLEKFCPGIPPGVAAFSMGAEAQSVVFRHPPGDLRLAVFAYPTPQMAIQKVEEFQKTAGLVAKRSGPLVAAVIAPADRDAAERLLSQVRYEAQVTLSERMPTRRDNIGDLVVNAFILIGILLGFSLVAGFAFGGVRVARKLMNKGADPEPMITLHLENR